MEIEYSRPGPAARAPGGSYTVAWVLLAVAAVVNTVGLLLGWFERWAWFDEVTHAYSFFAMALVAGLHLYGPSGIADGRHKALLVFTVLCVGLALGVVWEWGEWAYDHLSGPKNAILGKSDTLTDLIMDGIGAAAAGVLMVAMMRRSRA